MSIDRHWYACLIQPVEDRMIRCIWRIVRNPEDAEDTLQDALAVIWKRLDRIRVHANPHALILKICVDTAYDTLRRKIRWQKYIETDENLEKYTETEPPVHERLADKERELQILDAIQKLSKKQAVSVLMRIVQERPYEEIAQALGTSEATVRTHVARGRNRLQQILSPLLHDRVEDTKS